jgi:putative aldouronate transport system substrate-binding protein
MKNARKALTATVAAAALALTGCSSQPKDDNSTSSAPYEVNFAYLSIAGAPTPELKKAVNELTMKELNMTVNLIPISFADYFSKIPLMMASGDPLDITFVFQQDYGTFINSQYIVNAADYADQTKDIYSLLGEDANVGKVGDFLIGFPTVKELSSPSNLVVRKDVFDELGYKVDDFRVTDKDPSGYDKITEMFGKVKAAHPDMTAFDGTFSMGMEIFSYIDPLGDSGFGVLEDKGQTTKVTNWFESEQFKTFAEINREWYTKGYTSQDVATNLDEGHIKMKAGNLFSYITFANPAGAAQVESLTGQPVELIPLSGPGFKSTSTATAALLSVANAAKDKTKAFEFLNWAYTNGEFNDLLNWGVKGVDWVETEPGIADYPEGKGPGEVSFHNGAGFILPNQFSGHVWAGSPANLGELYAKANTEAKASKAYGFMFDQQSVSAELAQLNAVYEQYKKQISFGVLDPASGIKEFNDALDKAGLQRVIDEKQKQLDAWLAAKK